MRKTKLEKKEINSEKLSKKEMTIETFKGVVFSLSLQILAKIMLIILESEELKTIVENFLKSINNLF